ncbi:MAG: 30S ribosomal protein S9 [bacterium]|nr:MAG: 30S ribosomal protein S9 [bacterium]
MESKRLYSTGRRKTATARVWISVGDGKINVNNKSVDDYFQGYSDYIKIIEEPFLTVNSEAKFDVKATVKGSGKSAQAEAVRHGISKALLLFDQTYRQSLKKRGFLTRDPRAKERKKYGHKGARASFQWSKR